MQSPRETASRWVLLHVELLSHEHTDLTSKQAGASKVLQQQELALLLGVDCLLGGGITLNDPEGVC